MTRENILENRRDGAVDSVVSRAKKSLERAKQSASTAEPPGQAPGELDKEKQKQAKELAKALDKLYQPENFAPLIRAPADIMLAISGDKIWNMEDKEVAVLSASAANVARYFVAADPKWIALTIFASALFTSYGSRTVVYLRRKQKEESEKNG